MRVLVCGGRDYQNRSLVYVALGRIHDNWGISCIIQGGADGADQLAIEWAGANGVIVGTFLADWKARGPAAGPMRNKRMIVEGKPDYVIAFPGGRGTADMVRQAEAAGLEVWKP
jgi:predicted Rossmann-fold nucleotide-binding protein